MNSYEQLIALHAAGKLGARPADMSIENLDVAKRIHDLLRTGVESSDPQHAAEEIHALAERCFQALTGREASPPNQGD